MKNISLDIIITTSSRQQQQSFDVSSLNYETSGGRKRFRFPIANRIKVEILSSALASPSNPYAVVLTLVALVVEYADSAMEQL